MRGMRCFGRMSYYVGGSKQEGGVDFIYPIRKLFNDAYDEACTKPILLTSIQYYWSAIALLTFVNLFFICVLPYVVGIFNLMIGYAVVCNLQWRGLTWSDWKERIGYLVLTFWYGVILGIGIYYCTI